MSDDHYAQALLRFSELLEQARQSADPEPTAMTLATVSPQGRPSARAVLLKAFDADGFVFYTHVTSHKGRDLAQSPAAALLFHWKHLGHGVQVRIEGLAHAVSEAEADAYFASRPRLSQIGAWASQQSETLPQREDFERRIERYEREYADKAVPRPPHWSGFRVVPDRFEFWYGAQFRLHERQVCEQIDGRWQVRMLYP